MYVILTDVLAVIIALWCALSDCCHSTYSHDGAQAVIVAMAL